MEFKLRFKLPEFPERISIRKPLLLMGSCFAEHMGERLQVRKFDTLLNPAGIIFNPISILQLLQRPAGELFSHQDIFESRGLWHSWAHHGSLAASTADEALLNLNRAQEQIHQYAQRAEWLVLSLGSAHVYTLKSSGQIVANCHKMEAGLFEKRLLTVEEILAALHKTSQLLRQKNPSLNILLSVSPVRYLRDGLVENNLSKAVLLQAVHSFCHTAPRAFYFPAYEIVMDELRDYRFFERDMTHPNALAIDYVWERFAESLLDEESQEVLKVLAPLLQARQHRPLFAGTAQHRQFMHRQAELCQALMLQYPFLHLAEELRYFSAE